MSRGALLELNLMLLGEFLGGDLMAFGIGLPALGFDIDDGLLVKRGKACRLLERRSRSKGGSGQSLGAEVLQVARNCRAHATYPPIDLPEFFLSARSF